MAVLRDPRKSAHQRLVTSVSATVIGALLVAAAYMPAGSAAGDLPSPTVDPASGPATSLPRVRLLSQEQYFNSLAYVFGPDISVAAHFTPFRRTDGLVEAGASV